MKKSIDRIIIFVGLAVMFLGQIITGFTIETISPETVAANLPLVLAVLATCFAFSEKPVMKSVGFGLGTITGVGGVYDLMLWVNDSAHILPGTMIITIIGELIFLAAAIIYFIAVCIKFFGYKKLDGNKSVISDDIEKLVSYKAMQTDGILTDEEFNSIKGNIFKSTIKASDDVDDLKKWKKLLDKQIITEEEFKEIKAKILAE